MPENDHDVAAPSRNDHDVDRNKAKRSMRWWMPQNWPDAPTWPTGMPHSCPPPLCQVAIQIQIQRKIRRHIKMINIGGLTKLWLLVQNKADASTSNKQKILLWCCLNPTHYCSILKKKLNQYLCSKLSSVQRRHIKAKWSFFLLLSCRKAFLLELSLTSGIPSIATDHLQGDLHHPCFCFFFSFWANFWNCAF